MEDTRTDHLPTVESRLERIEGMIADLREDLVRAVERSNEIRDDLEAMDERIQKANENLDTRIERVYEALERVSERQDSARGRLERSMESDLDGIRYDVRNLETKVSSLERNSRW